MEKDMSVIIKMPVSGSISADEALLDEIIEFGRKALRQKRSEELAFDLLGLDGVQLPLDHDIGTVNLARLAALARTDRGE
jgi:hypothetical protein